MAHNLEKNVETALAAETAPAPNAEATPTLSRTSSAVDPEKGSGTSDAPHVQSGILEGARLYAVFGSLMLGTLRSRISLRMVADLRCLSLCPRPECKSSSHSFCRHLSFNHDTHSQIVATAIPIFTSEFNAFSQVSWVITGYFRKFQSRFCARTTGDGIVRNETCLTAVTQCGLILFVGQILTIAKAKWVLLVAFFFFELGSLIAGVAKSMTVLIVGRAIQGVGESSAIQALVTAQAQFFNADRRNFGHVLVDDADHHGHHQS